MVSQYSTVKRFNKTKTERKKGVKTSSRTKNTRKPTQEPTFVVISLTQVAASTIFAPPQGHHSHTSMYITWVPRTMLAWTLGPWSTSAASDSVAYTLEVTTSRRLTLNCESKPSSEPSMRSPVDKTHATRLPTRLSRPADGGTSSAMLTMCASFHENVGPFSFANSKRHVRQEGSAEENVMKCARPEIRLARRRGVKISGFLDWWKDLDFTGEEQNKRQKGVGIPQNYTHTHGCRVATVYLPSAGRHLCDLHSRKEGEGGNNLHRVVHTLRVLFFLPFIDHATCDG